MRNKLALFAVLVFGSMLLLAPAPLPVVAQDNPLFLENTNNDDVYKDVCRSNPQATVCVENRNTGSQTPNDNRIYGPNGVLTRIARLLLTVVGIAATIVIIVSGLRYVLSSGDPSNVSSAKNTLIYAIVGLVIAVLSQALIVFIVNNVL